jgi:cytochrome c-type biogenesis protein
MIGDGSALGILTAFLAGIASFLSPCVLPLVPGYVSYVAGQSLKTAVDGSRPRAKLSALALSVFFVLGFSTVFIALGASASALGQLFLRYRYEANLVGGALIFTLGLFLAGILRPFSLQRELRFHPNIPGGRPLAAYAVGLAFAFGWTPCIGPVLGAILTLSATSSEGGVTLLSAYSLGLGLPFLASAFFTGALLARLKALGSVGRRLQVAAGALLAIMGVAMMTGNLEAFSYWLLETFPVLAKIG